MRTVSVSPRRVSRREVRQGESRLSEPGAKIPWFKPFSKLLRPRGNGKAVYPTLRIMLFLFLGSSLSFVGVQLSGDEYYEGPGFVGEHVETLPVHIAFEDLGCQVQGRKRPVLSNITGEIRPGRLTGVMGQTGSGKTTFAHKLLGRTKRLCSGNEGAIWLNGSRNDLERLLDRVGYVEQFDVLTPELTVEEALKFSASWRLPRDLSPTEYQAIVDDVLETLDLAKVRERRISDISGGERKRTSIGAELVSRPSVMVMDEPTSGLDSAGTFQLMSMFKAVASRGVSVVTVIHQPSARVYDLLDDLILLQNGEAVYAGPRSGVLPFLSSAGFDPPLSGAPEAEFILDVLAGLEAPTHESRIALGPLCVEDSLDEETGYCISKVDNKSHAVLPLIFQEYSKEARVSILANVDSQETLWCGADDAPGMLDFVFQALGVELCQSGETRVLCRLFSTRNNYQQLPKPGLKRQVQLWFSQLMILKWRRGLWAELCATACLAGVVAFVRSFNGTWNRRPVSNLFLSISVSLSGMIGAVFKDDIAVVQRAASAGMLLGAFEFAMLAESIIWGWFICHVFTFWYFLVLWMRTGMCIIECPPSSNAFFVRIQKAYEFSYLCHLNFLASNALGSAICVFANHDQPVTYVCAVALLIGCHVFSFFSPNQHQVKEDSILFGVLDISPLIVFLSNTSYVRYFLEAAFLWDNISTHDPNGRRYVMKYFGYEDKNLTMCSTRLFSLWTFAQACRFVVFGWRNSNDFHSLYDTPFFLSFIFKVLACHICALLIMTLIQDTIYGPLQERLRVRDEPVVDILSIDARRNFARKGLSEEASAT